MADLVSIPAANAALEIISATHAPLIAAIALRGEV
jgi:hypothetical protein